MLKLNHIELRDEFSIKTHKNVKKIVRRLLKEFSNKQGNKGTLNDLFYQVDEYSTKQAQTVSLQSNNVYRLK